MTLRSAFVKAVSSIMDKDAGVVLLLGDIAVYGFRETFAKHPRRCFNVGVCEQAMVGAASGLAMGGYYPILVSIESFLCRRPYEFVFLDFGIQRLSGLFIGLGGAREYAKLGPTHCSAEVPYIMSKVPGMSTLIPASEAATEACIESCVKDRRLAFVRVEEPT